MKTIILLGAAPVGGAMRYPSEGEFDVKRDPTVDKREISPDEAAALVEVGLAKDASLTKLTVDALRLTATEELVDVPADATKPDLVEAISAARAAD